MKETRQVTNLVALSSLMLLLAGLYLGGFQLVIASVSAEFHLDKTGMGLLVAVEYISMILMPSLSGLWADKVGKKPVLLTACASVMLGCLAAGVSHSLAPYVVGIFLVGGGGVVLEAITSATISDLAPEKSNRYINLCQCFFSTGAIVGPLALQAALDAGIPWRVLYAVYGIGILLLLLPLIRTPLPGPAERRTALGSPMTFLRAPAFLMLFLSIVFYVGLENGFGYFAASLFDLGLDAPHLGAYAISAFWAGMAVSRLISSVRSFSASKSVVLYYVGSAAGLLILALSRSPWLSLAVSFLTGFGYGPIWSNLVALAAGEFPQRSAGAVGLMSTGCGIGGALYPVIMGAMADHLDIRVPFFLLTATALVGALLGIVYLRLKGRYEAGKEH